METLLSIVNLKKYFPVSGGIFGKKKYLRANENISFDIKKGETFSIVGESGSGKSTLGKTLLGLQKPTSGKVLYYGRGVTEIPSRVEKIGDKTEGVDLATLKDEEMRALRKHLQIVFQDPYSSLNPRMTVGQIVEEGVATHRIQKRGTPQMREYVLEVMRSCGLPKEALPRYPHQFSGGQRQRVCIARALAVKPEFVVCDECVSALDVSVQSQILNLLGRLKEEAGLTYLFISHDLSVVRHVSDRVAVMYLGQIMEMGDVEEVFENPRHPYTIALLSAAPSMGKREKKILLQGSIPSPLSPPAGCPFHTRCFMAQECCQRIPAPLKEVEKGHTVACHFAEVPTREKRKNAVKA